MTHTQKRKIIVDNENYEWCIRGNGVWKDGDHITIYKAGVKGTPIYLDPFPWSLEIRPKTIEHVIKFALKANWKPAEKGKPLKLGYMNEKYIVLPEDMNYTSVYEASLNK